MSVKACQGKVAVCKGVKVLPPDIFPRERSVGGGRDHPTPGMRNDQPQAMGNRDTY